MRTPRLLVLLLMLSLTTVAPIAVAQTTQQLVEQGNAAQATGNYAQAETLWRQVLQGEPNNAEAYVGLGNIQFLLANQSWKVSEYGDVLKERKKLGDAMADSRIAALVSPSDYYSYIKLGETLLGLALHRQKKLDKAVAAYRQAIQLSPNDAEAYNRLGNALQDFQKLDEVIAAYRKAVELAPNNPVFYSFLGSALFAQKKLPEAIAAYRKAIQLDANKDQLGSLNPFLHIGLGNTFQQLGRRVYLLEALRQYQRAEQIGGTGPLARDKILEIQRLCRVCA
jgi:superkiller protein 3